MTTRSTGRKSTSLIRTSRGDVANDPSCPFKVNLEPGKRPVQACVSSLEQAALLIKEHASGMGQTQFYSGYELGDPRANEVRFQEHEQRGAILDSAGNVVGHAWASGNVVWGPGKWKAGRTPLWEAPKPPPRPRTPQDAAADWVRWYNMGFEWKWRGKEQVKVEVPRGPAPVLDPIAKSHVEDIFGLQKCREISALLGRS